MVRSIDGLAKEPLMASPSGIGYLGVLLYDDVEDKVQCSECGQWYKTLGIHLRDHKITAREYKEKYELNYGTALAIPSISDAKSVRHEFMWKLNNEDLTPEEIHKAAVKRGMAGGKKSADNMRRRGKMRLTVEMMNRFGTCPKQLEERFIQAVEKIGHTPSWDELYTYDASLLATLFKRFKGYTNALTYFGLKGKRRVISANYTVEEIEGCIEKFVNDYKRLPNPKDTKLGYLPDYMTVVRHMGSWKQAKEYAYEILKKEYPHEATVYDKDLRRIAIIPPFAGGKAVKIKKRKPRMFPVGELTYLEEFRE